MKVFCIALIIFFFTACHQNRNQYESPLLAEKVHNNQDFHFVKKKAAEIIASGFNAGDGYGEVWIRDLNTFIELACEIHPPEEIEAHLLVFFRMQGKDGNILDGFTPIEKVPKGSENFYFSDLEPRYAGHKNTVETDQETSLVQAIYKFIRKTGRYELLNKEIAGLSVEDRLDLAMNFLMKNRFSTKHGLIWGATTADWGDVQPEHTWGVLLSDESHPAIDIYDNAMFLIALDNLIEMVPDLKSKWKPIYNTTFQNARRQLWDKQNQKFIPHIYLEGSPFPGTFDENEIYYHGGTAIAIEAGLLSKEEILISLDKMMSNVQLANASSIGLTMYPPYPEGFFMNKAMYPYGYQNGGDWTWFGGRMIQQLIRYGFLDEAYDQIQPMTRRVVENNGFFEWYTPDNQPKGSGTFRGSAGVLYTAIVMLETASN